MTPIIGLVGGIAPPSTIDYYRQIISEYRERDLVRRCPAMVITSVDLKHVIDLLRGRRYRELTELIVDEVSRLERAGATFGAITSNTAHIVFDEVAQRSTLPLVSIIEATCAEAARLGIRRPALIGTKFLMRAPEYPRVFASAGIQIILPTTAEQDAIHERYLGELVHDVFTPETRWLFLAIARRLRDEDGADALILGGTEIPLLVRGGESESMRFLDTTRIHVAALVSRLIASG